MTIDHVGYVLNTIYSYNLAGGDFNMVTDGYWWMRVIGRMAFPIFCFLIAEGCAHTKDIKKYIGRLAVFALISQIPYQIFSDINHGGIDEVIRDFFTYNSGNVFVTLTFGAVAVLLYKTSFSVKSLHKALCIIGIPAIIVVSMLIRIEYEIGLLTILLIYVFRPKNESDADAKVIGSKYLQVFCCAFMTLIMYLMYNSAVYMTVSAVLSAIFLLFYNRQPGNRRGKWLFYIYYPAHMLILSAVVLLATM